MGHRQRRLAEPRLARPRHGGFSAKVGVPSKRGHRLFSRACSKLVQAHFAAWQAGQGAAAFRSRRPDSADVTSYGVNKRDGSPCYAGQTSAGGEQFLVRSEGSVPFHHQVCYVFQATDMSHFERG